MLSEARHQKQAANKQAKTGRQLGKLDCQHWLSLVLLWLQGVSAVPWGVRNGRHGSSSGSLLRIAASAALLAAWLACALTVFATFLSWSQNRERPLAICTQRRRGSRIPSWPICLMHCKRFLWQSSSRQSISFTARFLGALSAGGKSRGTDAR